MFREAQEEHHGNGKGQKFGHSCLLTQWLEFFLLITLELLLQIEVMMEEAHDDA
jgi:hypothetical protein